MLVNQALGKRYTLVKLTVLRVEKPPFIYLAMADTPKKGYVFKLCSLKKGVLNNKKLFLRARKL